MSSRGDQGSPLIRPMKTTGSCSNHKSLLLVNRAKGSVLKKNLILSLGLFAATINKFLHVRCQQATFSLHFQPHSEWCFGWFKLRKPSLLEFYFLHTVLIWAVMCNFVQCAVRPASKAHFFFSLTSFGRNANVYQMFWTVSAFSRGNHRLKQAL